MTITLKIKIDPVAYAEDHGNIDTDGLRRTRQEIHDEIRDTATQDALQLVCETFRDRWIDCEHHKSDFA